VEPRIELTSHLAAPAEQVWKRVTSPAGINAELRPLLRMTMPRGLAGTAIAELPRNRPLGRSWLLLFGLLPVDYDRLCLVEVEPPRRFLERSQMATLSPWQHERVVEPLAAGGCTVTDRLAWELRGPLRRLPGADALAGRIVAALFGHRHRRLRTLDNPPG
jgi:hypothetical protein